MQVVQVIKNKSSSGTITVTAAMSVAEAVDILSSRKIGAVIVSEDGETPEGIVSERDIVRELGRQGAAVLNLRVADVMTRTLTTCSLTDTVGDVLSRMTQGRFRHMPVMEQGKMIGLISIGDAVKARVDALEMEKDALTGMIMGA